MPWDFKRVEFGRYLMNKEMELVDLVDASGIIQKQRAR